MRPTIHGILIQRRRLGDRFRFQSCIFSPERKAREARVICCSGWPDSGTDVEMYRVGMSSRTSVTCAEIRDAIACHRRRRTTSDNYRIRSEIPNAARVRGDSTRNSWETKNISAFSMGVYKSAFARYKSDRVFPTWNYGRGRHCCFAPITSIWLEKSVAFTRYAVISFYKRQNK